MRTVILAGGYATRLWPLTLHRPKPLLPIAGRPLLDYLLKQIPPEWLPAILSVNRRFWPSFSAWARGKPVELWVEETRKEEEKLGAVRALAHLVETLGVRDDLLVLAGDNWLRLDLRRFWEAAAGRPAVALFPLDDPGKAKGRYGVAVVEDGLILAFQEKPEKPRSNLASTACYFFPRDVLPLLGEFIREAPQGHDAPGYFLQWLLARRPIVAFTEVEDWLDVGDRVSYLEANMRVTHGESWVHPGARISGSELIRTVVLGPCLIEGSRLRECVVDEGVKLQGVELEKVLVGKGAWLRG
ncbi:MAG: nucleotidyltransferase family protein [Candidatus Bipolaricaulaceae bacterium]